MRIIIPMAGRGTRLRPHTLATPKPLLPVAGKQMVHRIVEDIVKVCQKDVSEIAFIIGSDFGQVVETQLLAIASQVGAKGIICYQDQKLGTAHAIYCAKQCLIGEVVIAFADTLFKADFTLNRNDEATIWTQRVHNPELFGVVTQDKDGFINAFVEKPQTFITDLAMIGIYYFKDGANLCKEIEYLLDNNLDEKGEFQLTSALENMKNKGMKIRPEVVTEWLDCGNKEALVHTNTRYLDYIKDEKDLIHISAQIINSVIIPPVFIGENVQIINSIIGSHVSIGKNTIIENSVIKNSLIQEDSVLQNTNAEHSLVGSFVKYQKKPNNLNLGDFSQIIF